MSAETEREDLSDRGEGSRLRGEELKYVGLPIGGIGCGQLYLGGDGRLWLWDVDNRTAPANINDLHFTRPMPPSSPVEHGFAVRVTDGDDVRTRWLDARGFPGVTFAGRPPTAAVDYADAQEPVQVRLDACSPFIPTEIDDSSYPAVFLDYTAANAGPATVDVEIAGFMANPVCLTSRHTRPLRLRSQEFALDGAAGVQFTAAEGADDNPARADLALEDWEKPDYSGWSATGDAFGTGPVRTLDRPGYQGEAGAFGMRMVDSHASAPGEDAGARDRATGTLRSEPFRIDRNYLRFRISGGNYPGTCCLNVVVDGEIVGTATGSFSDHLADRVLYLGPWQGKDAVVEIIDAETGPWGHVGVDQLRLTDHAPAQPALPELPDLGSAALATLGADRAQVLPAAASWNSPQDIFEPTPGASTVDGLAERSAAVVRAGVTLAPGEQRTIRFVLAWFFPVPDREGLSFLEHSRELLRHYAARFGSAQDVVAHLAREQERLIDGTRAWQRAWYEDSTLPHWLLERIATNTTILSTSTCYRFADGRFYGWEGAYCCAGTCTHVWHYAHALARLFPTVERDIRERVDLGIGFHAATGQLSMRGEADRSPAVDGQAGTILRIYREHQMSPDSQWLQRVWPRTRQAVEYLIASDAEPDGTLDGAQPNTQDATWFGRNSWLSGLYVAALRAGAAMAGEAGDDAFARRCAELAANGTEVIVRDLFNGEYFVHERDPAHPGSVNTNRGCFADQLLGQSWAAQLGLPRVLPPEPTRSALRSIWRHNFVPRPMEYRENSPIEGGRIFYDADVPALVMCAWPNGGGDEAGDNWSVSYFNEAWHGIEYQVAAHLIAEGMVGEGLAVARSVHDRYGPLRRNPYNEIECSDHYARSMASFGTYLSALGFEHHGPGGHLGFAPKIGTENFAAAFTTAEGWGTYRQTRAESASTSSIDLHHGRLNLRTLRLDATSHVPRATLDGTPVEVHPATDDTGRPILHFPNGCTINAGQNLHIEL
ncbi:GH116 family glycosyl hydrolase [Saccharopolyspora sp. ASAGF58]|uniref:GH116 family glycosyl hydrolase n=1 Tax=Saccharopolyspora sp. ASAGF58 TaxID=2719023 RepID=UPI001445656B|nr:GH116 family glycosyl hydrolase [Saccharopolyspora sp. ASAGF58]